MSRSGTRRRGRWCWVRFAPEQADDVPRVGYAIGRSLGNAVLRNRVRRRLRPIVAAEAPRLGPGVYLIGVHNAQAATVSHDELRKELCGLLQAVQGVGEPLADPGT